MIGRKTQPPDRGIPVYGLESSCSGLTPEVCIFTFWLLSTNEGGHPERLLMSALLWRKASVIMLLRLATRSAADGFCGVCSVLVYGYLKAHYEACLVINLLSPTNV